jgi:hypothetical protein
MEYQLEIEDVKLRDKKWVEFIQRVPDRDAVADQFYQFIGKGSKIRKFKVGQAELILELDSDKYRKINEHRELEEEKRQGEDENSVQVVGQKRHRATLSHDHSTPTPSNSQTFDLFTAEAPIPPIPAALPSNHTPALLPPSLALETSRRDAARVATYHWQKALPGPSKIDPKAQGTVRTSFHICGHIDLTISNFQVGSNFSSSRKHSLNLENGLTESGKLSSDVISSAATVLRSPDSKRLRGALLGIKAPSAKIIRKMSRS